MRGVTTDFTLVDHAAVAWERFTHLFRDGCVPPVERKRLAHEFPSLKKKTEIVTEITRMFHERELFFPEHMSTEQAHVSR